MSLLGKVKKKVSDFFKPDPNQTRVRDVVREAPRTLIKADKKILKFAKESAVDMARAFPRAVATVAATTSKKKELVPKTKADKFVFGDKPVKNIRGTGEDTLTGFGTSDRTAAKFAIPIGLASTGLDLIPFTSGKAKTASKLAKSASQAKFETNLLKAEELARHSDLVQKRKLQLTDKTAIKQIEKAQAQIADQHYKLTTPPKKPTFIKTPEGKFAGSKSSEAGFTDPQAIHRDIRTQLEDRLYPIRELTKGKVKPGADPYVQARLFAGHFGRAQGKLDELSKILTPGKKKLPETARYAQLERELELGGRGVSKFEGGRTLDQIRAEKAAMDARPDAVEIRTFADEIRGYSDKLLDELKTGGILSDEAYQGIKANNLKYTPFDRAEYLAEQIDNLPRGTKSFSVGKQDVVHQLKGSEKQITNPIESLVKKTYKITSLVERNKVALKMADLSQLDDFKDVVVPLKGEVPAGMGKFSVFRNGVKEEYAVPKVIEEALKGVGVGEADLVTKIMNQISTKPLRLGATSLNVPFLGSNVIRDFTSAKINSPVGFSMKEWIGGLASVLKKDDAYKRFLDSGASFSGFFEQGKNLPKTAKSLTRGKLIKATYNLNPIRLIQKVGEVAELTPRVGVFKRGIRKGLSEAESAFNARNATVDFAKSGSALKVVNMWTPFLNARLQGTLNTVRAFRDRPIKSAFVTSYMVGLPAVATYLNNTRYHKEIWDDIAQFEKQNNFLVIYGDERDEDGNPTQVIKIPKPDVGRIVGNPLENFMAYLDKENTRPLSELAIQTFSDISPVGFERDGKFSGAAALSGVLPPLPKVGVESVTNKNLFTGYDIVPQRLKDASPKEQYKSSTAPAAVKLGGAINASPLKIENAAGTLFGGLGRQLINPAKAGEKMAGRFVGARGGAQEKKVEQSAEDFLKTQEDEDAQIYRKAERLLKDFDTSPPSKEEWTQLKKADPQLAKKVGDLKRQRDLNFTSKDFVIQDLGVENGMRAKFILQELNKLSTEEEKKALWEDLKAKKLLSKEVSNQIKYLVNKESN